MLEFKPLKFFQIASMFYMNMQQYQVHNFLSNLLDVEWNKLKNYMENLVRNFEKIFDKIRPPS